jgi:hypothetical protein
MKLLKINKICKPAKLYLILSAFFIIFSIFNEGIKILTLVLNCIFIGIWTVILNYFCKKAGPVISYILVLFPFFIILFLFSLKKREGFNDSNEYTCNDPNGTLYKSGDTHYCKCKDGYGIRKYENLCTDINSWCKGENTTFDENTKCTCIPGTVPPPVDVFDPDQNMKKFTEDKLKESNSDDAKKTLIKMSMNLVCVPPPPVKTADDIEREKFYETLNKALKDAETYNKNYCTSVLPDYKILKTSLDNLVIERNKHLDNIKKETDIQKYYYFKNLYNNANININNNLEKLYQVWEDILINGSCTDLGNNPRIDEKYKIPTNPKNPLPLPPKQNIVKSSSPKLAVKKNTLLSSPTKSTVKKNTPPSSPTKSTVKKK